MTKTKVGESMHKRRRGIVGIEAAIILIAFVIVAAAVAFVALNMGMTASQKSKEAMSKGLAQASTALEVDGDVIGYSPDAQNISSVAIPLRVAPGWNSVDLSHTNVTVIIRLPGGKSYTFTGLLNASNIKKLSGENITSILAKNPNPGNPVAVINVTDYDGNPDLLTVGEKAWLTVYLPDNDYYVGPYGMITVEILPPKGAPLTVTRYIPATIYQIGAIDLG